MSVSSRTPPTPLVKPTSLGGPWRPKAHRGLMRAILDRRDASERVGMTAAVRCAQFAWRCGWWLPEERLRLSRAAFATGQQIARSMALFAVLCGCEREPTTPPEPLQTYPSDVGCEYDLIDVRVVEVTS